MKKKKKKSKCIACSGTGKNSQGDICYPCQKRREEKLANGKEEIGKKEGSKKKAKKRTVKNQKG